MGTPATGSFSLPAALSALAEATIRDGQPELGRAEGNRGMVYLKVEVCLGDDGKPLWANTAVHFEHKRHYKDARGTPNDEA